MRDSTQTEPGGTHVLAIIAGVVAVFLVLAFGYVGYQSLHVLFPPNTYETALLSTVSDTVDAEGVLLFQETYVAGSGTLGYLAEDGERVSAGTAVAEVYSDATQSTLRQQLRQINDQIDLLQRSQNTSATQLDSLHKERSSALYDMLDALDQGEYDEIDTGRESYLLAQNKLWVITGEVTDFSDSIAALTQQAASVQAQLGTPSQITAPQTGYFIRSSSSGRLNASADDILALGPAELKAYVESDPQVALDGCAGKIVSGFTWYYAGVCPAKQGEKLLGQDGKPLKKSVQIRFPGQMETPLKAKVTEVTIDEASGLARFVLSCEIINGDVLRLTRRCADHRGGDDRSADPVAGHPLFKGGRHRGGGKRRKLPPGRLRQVRQPRPVLQDRPRGRGTPADHRGRLHAGAAQRNGQFGQSDPAL